MQNPAETMRKLRRLAQGSTNEAESEMARQALAALVKQYPDEAALLEVPIMVDVPFTLRGDGDFELDLFVTVSEFLGCSVVRTVGTRRTKVMVRGPHGAAHAVLDMFPALAARQADELTRRLTALGVVVPSGLDRPPYLLSHEALCALLQQAEAKAETERLLLQASAERIRIHGLLSALFRSPPNQQASELPMWAVIKDLLHVGATRAHELCAEFGHDPDEKVAGLVVDGLCLVCDVMFCTRCEELTHVPEGHKPQCEHCEPEESAGGAS